MSMRTLIVLEAGLVEGQFLRNRGDIQQHLSMLRFIQSQTASKLDEELSREVHSYDRKEMQILLLKQAKLVEDLKTELECAFMAMEDGEMRSITVREKRMRYASKVISFLQAREARVCNYGQKLIERAESFAKKFVIETLDWRSTPEHDVEWNHQLWKLENEFASIIGTAPTPEESDNPRIVNINEVSNGIAEELLVPNGVIWAPGQTREFDKKNWPKHPRPDSVESLLRPTQAAQTSAAYTCVGPKRLPLQQCTIYTCVFNRGRQSGSAFLSCSR